MRADVGGDVLAGGAVAARGAAHQLAVLVAQRQRQAVDLRLGHERPASRRRQPQEAPDAGDELGHVLFVERVVEREHRHGVATLANRPTAPRRPAATAILADQLGKARLDRVVAPAQRIVLGVRNRRRIVLIVARSCSASSAASLFSSAFAWAAVSESTASGSDLGLPWRIRVRTYRRAPSSAARPRRAPHR